MGVIHFVIVYLINLLWLDIDIVKLSGLILLDKPIPLFIIGGGEDKASHWSCLYTLNKNYDYAFGSYILLFILLINLIFNKIIPIILLTISLSKIWQYYILVPT